MTGWVVVLHDGSHSDLYSICETEAAAKRTAAGCHGQAGYFGQSIRAEVVRVEVPFAVGEERSS